LTIVEISTSFIENERQEIQQIWVQVSVG
jgi:hypothetical protein